MNEDTFLDPDLFTEPGDSEPHDEPTQNESDFDTLATGLAEFYWGLRNRKVPRRVSFKLTETFLNYMLTLGGRL